MSDPTEESLVRRLRRRDEDAFRELVEAYQGRVYGLVFRMIGNQAEAEDVAQEVFVTVFKAIDSFRGDAKLSTWLYRIATNHCKNRLKYLQRRHHDRTRDIDDTPEGDYGGATHERAARPDEEMAGRELEAAIQAGLAALEEEHRVVVILRDIDQLSYVEIAEIVGVPEGTIKSRLFRGRAALRAFVEEQMRR